MQPNLIKLRTKRADGVQWERVVYAEVLIPETRNVYGDYWTEDGIRDAVYQFMYRGVGFQVGIDVEHDNIDRSGAIYMVESFIARPGDPDFIAGSWVVALKIDDDEIWQKVLDNEINGYSYEAVVEFLAGQLRMDDDGVRTGYTEPDLIDGHRHGFMVLVDSDNRPVTGGTDEVNGHSHDIFSHTVTGKSSGHTHRYNLVSGVKGK